MPPNYLSSAPAFFDVRRDRLVYFEGRSRLALWSVTADAPRTWAFTPLGGTSQPDLGRDNWVYDPTGDRLLSLDALFTPLDSCCHYTYVASVVSTSLGATPQTTRLPVRGSAPVSRDSPMFTYDSRRHRALVIGGTPRDTNGVLSSRVDAFDVDADSGSWSGFDVTAAPLPVQRGTALYDSLTDQVIVLGGTDAGRNVGRQSIYSLDLANPTAWQAWTLADSMSLPSDYPAAMRIFLDAGRRRILLASRPDDLIIVYGMASGAAAESAPRSVATAADSTRAWSLDIDTRTGWTPISYAGPSPGDFLGQMVYDPIRDRMSAYGRDNRNELVELVLDGVSPWTTVHYSDAVPTLADAEPYFEAGGRRMIIASGAYSQVWTVQRGAYDAWHQLSYANRPRERDYAAVVYDSLNHKGFEFGGNLLDAELGDLWQFTITDSDHVAWQRLFLDGDVPSPRWGAATILDPVRRRMILFGGYAGRPLNDTWELTLDAPMHWRRLPDRGSPPPGRFLASAVYDSRRDAMIVYGGDFGAPHTPQLTDDSWELSFADGDTWVPIVPIGRPPAPRSSHGAVYDPKRDRMIVFWGRGYYNGRFDCAELDLADGPTWQAYDPGGVVLPGASRFGVIYDPVREEALCIGGNGFSLNNYLFPSIGVDFTGDPVQSPPALVGPPLAVLGFAPNPTRDVENVAFDLPTDATVRARIYSAAGRLVRDLGDRRFVAGRHILLWDGKDQAGGTPASGVYFARLSILGRDFSGKFVYLR